LTNTSLPSHLLVFLFALSAAGCGGSSDGNITPIATQPPAEATSQPTTAPDEAEIEAATLAAVDTPLPTPDQSINDVLNTDPRLATLSQTAATIPDVAVPLANPGAFTLFAPTNDAFAALDPNLLQDAASVRNILFYHLLASRRTTEDLSSLTEASSMLGIPISLTGDAGSLQVGGANIVEADILTSNGIIHIIDAVLIPPEATDL